MGYMKTLLLDKSAARSYQHRYDRLAHNDQENGGSNTLLVVGHKGSHLVTGARLAEIVPPTREAVGKALRQWRGRVQHSPRDLNALNRAALNLEACLWYFRDDTLIVTSATNSRTRYHVTATTCDCPARGICWHRWAWTVLDSARRLAASQQPVQCATRDVQKDVDDLF